MVELIFWNFNYLNNIWNQLPGQHLFVHRPTQSVMYVPLQVNIFHESILLIVQYKNFKSFSGDFYSPESDPTHKIMLYLFYYSIWLGFYFHKTMLVLWKCFVPQFYQFRRGISGGPALKYLYMMYRGGRTVWQNLSEVLDTCASCQRKLQGRVIFEIRS